MEHKKDILCPDCLIEYISNEQLGRVGKCTSCMRRANMAKNSGHQYIPIKDLTEEEQLAIKQKRSERHQKNIAKQTGDIQIETVRRNAIYSPEMLDFIVNYAKAELHTFKEILNEVQSKYPDSKITYTNLSNVIRRMGLPCIKRPIRTVNKMEIATEEDKDTFKISDVIENQNGTLLIGIKEENTNDTKNINSINKSDKKDVINNNIDYNNYLYEEDIIKIDESQEPERFKKVRADVNDILTKKYKALKCNMDKDYNTTDYINAIEMLLYLKKNCGKIIKLRRDQHDVIEALQSDTIHEMENTIAEEGDTYLSDKFHVIRNKRRHSEYDCNDLVHLSNMLSALNEDSLQSTLDILKKDDYQRKHPIFIPLVDTDMISKYKWAKAPTPENTKLQKPILKTNARLKKAREERASNKQAVLTSQPEGDIRGNKIRTKTPTSIKKFRVTCNISGGGFGAFKKWYSDYNCMEERTALAYATNTLNQLKATHEGMLVSDLECHEINA